MTREIIDVQYFYCYVIPVIFLLRQYCCDNLMEHIVTYMLKENKD
jgi:hypothetical protein